MIPKSELRELLEQTVNEWLSEIGVEDVDEHTVDISEDILDRIQDRFDVVEDDEDLGDD